jgi:hypothetical protein
MSKPADLREGATEAKEAASWSCKSCGTTIEENRDGDYCRYCEDYWNDLDDGGFDDDYDDDLYEEPPLYPAGKLAGMTLEELERELDRQCDRQGRLGDADRIDDRAVEETEMRCRVVEAEIKRRKDSTSTGE